MGVVHRAEDRVSKRMVAFKQLRSKGTRASRRTVEALFEREFHALVRLKHARIVEVFDYGFTDQGPYYTMELLDGQDLQQIAPLPYREACRHLRDIASSLALIHAHRMVHRDVGPRNVISWGTDIAEAQRWIREAAHPLLFPSGFLTLTVLAFIMLGDAVREAFDPRLR